jgi:arylsulfatase
VGYRRDAAKFSEDKWELYNTNDDFSRSQDLASKYPDKLQELQRLFLAEAEKYNVLPLDDRRAEHFVPTICRQAFTNVGSDFRDS